MKKEYDVTALVSADVAGSGTDADSVLGEYVQLVEQGDGPVDQLQVDVTGGAGEFTTVATLDGDAGERRPLLMYIQKQLEKTSPPMWTADMGPKPGTPGAAYLEAEAIKRELGPVQGQKLGNL